MTQIRIRRVEDGAGDLIRASVSIWLVDADSKRRVAWHSAGGPITEITNLSLKADEIVDLVPQADIALDAAGTATQYLVRIVAQPEARRHPVTEDWYIQVPDSVDILELDDLVGATGIEPGSLASGRLLPLGATSGQIARYNGSAWIPDNESGGTGTTNLANTPSATEVTVESSSGTDTSIGAATSLLAGVMVAADKAKLDAIEASATADQTPAEIKTAYESNADTNEFSDAEQTKLAGIAVGAEANAVDSVNTQTGAVVLDAAAVGAASAAQGALADGAVQETGAEVNGVLRVKDAVLNLSPGDVIGTLEFYKADPSTGGAGVPVSVRAKTTNSGGAFALEFITGSVTTPVTPLVLNPDGSITAYSDVWAGGRKTSTYPSDKSWVVFGDSMSNSFMAGVDWPGDTKNIVGFTGTTTTRAVAGNKIEQQLSVLDTALATDPNYLDSYDILTFLIGMNDFNGNTAIGSRDDSVGAATFAGMLKEFIETSLGANPLIRIYLMTPIEQDYGIYPYQGANAAGWTLRQLSVLISQIGSDYGLLVIDLYSISGFNAQTIPTLTIDGLHPNSVGTAVLGKIVAEAFASGAGGAAWGAGSEWVSVPATLASSGTQGQKAYDASSSYLYECVATDTWIKHIVESAE